jgi:hypothetical protein
MLVLRAYHGRAKKPPLEADQCRILRVLFDFVIRPCECVAAAANEYRGMGVIIPG